MKKSLLIIPTIIVYLAVIALASLFVIKPGIVDLN